MFDNNGSFLLAMFEFFIFVAYLVGLFWVFGDVFRSQDLGGLAKTAWVLFIVVLPLLGALVYLIARGDGMAARQIESQRQVHEAQAEYIRNVAGSASSAGGSAGGSVADQITSAKSLLDSGAITQAEFEQLKAKALA